MKRERHKTTRSFRRRAFAESCHFAHCSGMKKSRFSRSRIALSFVWDKETKKVWL
jgi:hypothetical protein